MKRFFEVKKAKLMYQKNPTETSNVPNVTSVSLKFVVNSIVCGKKLNFKESFKKHTEDVHVGTCIYDQIKFSCSYKRRYFLIHDILSISFLSIFRYQSETVCIPSKPEWCDIFGTRGFLWSLNNCSFEKRTNYKNSWYVIFDPVCIIMIFDTTSRLDFVEATFTKYHCTLSKIETVAAPAPSVVETKN